MAQTDVNLPVRLTRDLPELGLRSGDAGVICSVWMSATAYEVEFDVEGKGGPMRVLLLEDYIDAPGIAIRMGRAPARGLCAVK